MQSTQNTRFAPEPTTNSERERAFRPIAPDNFSVLSRFLNLIFVANATLFIGSRLVITHGYWFCLVAIGLVTLAYGLIISPWSNLRSWKLYVTCFWLAAMATLLTIVSLIYWIHFGH